MFFTGLDDSPMFRKQINVVPIRGFIPVDDRMRVMDEDGNVLSNVNSYKNAVVKQLSGRDHILNHLSIPAACFTHPEISMVGLTEPQAREKADRDGFEISVVKTSFKANTKALAENEGDGIAKDLKLVVHAHPTLSEVLDELFKAAKVQIMVTRRSRK